MSSVVYRITGLLCRVVETAPVGTNLGLFHLLWTVLSGRLLCNRGAVIPALAQTGLSNDAVRRAWAALTYGAWQCEPILHSWRQIVAEEGQWKAHRHGGYRPVAADLVGFFRPHLIGLSKQTLLVGSRKSTASDRAGGARQRRFGQGATSSRAASLRAGTGARHQ